AHGSPLGEEEVKKTKQNLGWEFEEKFYIPDEVLQHFRKAKDEGEAVYERWQEGFEEYKKEYSAEADAFTAGVERTLPADFQSVLPAFDADEKGMATRASSGKVIQALAENIPHLIGGSADLTGSNKTWMDDEEVFGPQN